MHERLHGQDYDPGSTEAGLAGEWGWFGRVVGAAAAPAIDDDLAHVRPWGFHPSDVGVPTLLLHGARDRIAPIRHARWLTETIAGAELWERPEDGHISVMTSAVGALEWLAGR